MLTRPYPRDRGPSVGLDLLPRCLRLRFRGSAVRHRSLRHERIRNVAQSFRNVAQSSLVGMLAPAGPTSTTEDGRRIVKCAPPKNAVAYGGGWRASATSATIAQGSRTPAGRLGC